MKNVFLILLDHIPDHIAHFAASFFLFLDLTVWEIGGAARVWKEAKAHHAQCMKVGTFVYGL